MRALALALLLSWFAAPASAAGASSARTAPRQQPATGVAPITLPPMAPQLQTGAGLAGSLDMGGVLRAPGAVPLAAPFLDSARALPGVGFRPDLPVAPLPESAVAPRAEAASFLETFAPRLALPLTAPPPSAAMVTPASPLAQQSALMATRHTAVAEATSAMARQAAPAAETSQAFGDRVWTLLMGQKPSEASDSSAAPDERRWSDLGAGSPGSSARAEAPSTLSPAQPRSASERRDPAAARGAVPSVAAQVEQILSWPARFDLGSLFGLAQPASPASGRTLTLPIRRLVLKVYSMTLGVAYASIPGHGPVLEASTRLASPGAAETKAAPLETVLEAPAVALRDAVSSTGFESRTLGARAAVERAAPGAEAERFAFLQDSGERLPLTDPAFAPAAAKPAASPFSRKGAGPAPAAFLVVTLLPVLGAALMLAAGRE